MTLRKRIILQVGIAILLTSVLGITSVLIITKREFSSFVEQEDFRRARQMAPFIEGLYELGFDWDEMAQALGTIGLSDSSLSGGRRGFKGMMGPDKTEMRMPGMMNWTHMNTNRIIISDGAGIVRIDSEDDLIGSVYKRGGAFPGVKLKLGDETFGSVYIGSMIDAELSQSQSDFIEKLIRWISISTFAGFLLSAVIIWISLYKTLQPVTALTEAVNLTAQGKHEIRVPEKGVDELADLSRGFNKMNKSIADANRIRNDIFSNIAHELKTPLSLIQGNLEAVMDGVYDLSKETVGGILGEAKQLGKIIDDMSFLSKMTSGIQFDLDEIIAMDTLIADIVRGFEVMAEKEGLAIENLAELSELKVRGNSTKLRQAISNILSNALRHGSDGETVELFSRVEGREERRVILEILDHGSGVKTEELELIFNRLYRADKSRSRAKGGSGLGLSISREIIRIHGGRIRAENQPGAGLKVIIELPLDEKEGCCL